MNLNQRIETIRGDGIPGYNRKINEAIAAINWLLGVRVTNGRPVRESDQGPVFDLSQVNMQADQPWLIDPNGNRAHWVTGPGYALWGTGQLPTIGLTLSSINPTQSLPGAIQVPDIDCIGTDFNSNCVLHVGNVLANPTTLHTPTHLTGYNIDVSSYTTRPVIVNVWIEDTLAGTNSNNMSFTINL